MAQNEIVSCEEKEEIKRLWLLYGLSVLRNLQNILLWKSNMYIVLRKLKTETVTIFKKCIVIKAYESVHVCVPLLWSPNNIKLVCIDVCRQQTITCHFHCLQINSCFSSFYLCLCFQKKDFLLNTPPAPSAHIPFRQTGDKRGFLWEPNVWL